MTTPQHGPTDVTTAATEHRTAGRAYPEERTSGATEIAHDTYREPATGRRDRHDDLAASRDLVRWGPLWAGVMVTVASYLVMQLAIFAADLFGDGGDAGTWLSALAGCVAFFLGGLTAGATALWNRTADGVLNGTILWAFATVALLVLALVGGGTLLGPVSTVASDLIQVQDLNLQNPPADQVNEALSGARDAAGWALLGLGLALVASVLGGAAGAKIWPRRDTAGVTARDADQDRRRP